MEEQSEEKKKLESELASAQEAVSGKDARIAELEARVAELTPITAEVEALKEEKAAAELAEKQKQLAAFAEAQGLDSTNEIIASAIKNVDYAQLIAESVKKKPAAKPAVASYAMSGLTTKGEYGDLLDKA